MPTSEGEITPDDILDLITSQQSKKLDPPTCIELSTWIASGNCPHEALEAAGNNMRDLAQDGRERRMTGLTQTGEALFQFDEGGAVESYSIVHMAETWSNTPEDKKPQRFPITIIIRAWLEQLREVAPDRRPTGIIPNPCRITGYGQLPLMLESIQQTFAPGPVELANELQAGHLPGLEPAEDNLNIPALLLLYDSANVPGGNGGHGAPLSMRIWMESAMALQIKDRESAGRIVVKAKEMINWLWPNGGFKPSRHMEQLRQALDAVHNARIRWRGGLWAAVAVRNKPLAPDDDIILDINLPPGSGQGPLIHRYVMRQYGVRNTALYRAYLAMAYLWDEHGTSNGKVIQPTRPAVKRDDDGTILDERGRRVVNEKGNPVRNWRHSKAVPLGEREPNIPWKERYPLLTRRDVVKIVNPAGQQHHRETFRRAMKAFDTMAGEGNTTMETGLKTRDGEWAIRVMPPENWGIHWSPRALQG